MILASEIAQYAAKPEMAFWMANVGANGVCDMSRISGVKVDEDGKHAVFFIPKRFFHLIDLNLNERPAISLLMASLTNFDSIQIKGVYIEHRDSSSEEKTYYETLVAGLTKISNEMGLPGDTIFNPFGKEESITVKIRCNQLFNQTPKPGTGNKLA